MFRTNLQASVDPKFRLKLPVDLRRKLEERYGETEYYVTSIDGKEALIYAISEWEVVERRLSERDPSSPDEVEARKSRLLFLARHYGAEQSLDSQGRLLIPGALREGSGMRGEVILSWDVNHLVAVPKERYDQKLKEMLPSESDIAFSKKMGM